MLVNFVLGLRTFLNSTNMHSITPSFIQELDNQTKQVLHRLVAEGIDNGVVRPLPRIALAARDAGSVKR